MGSQDPKTVVLGQVARATPCAQVAPPAVPATPGDAPVRLLRRRPPTSPVLVGPRLLVRVEGGPPALVAVDGVATVPVGPTKATPIAAKAAPTVLLRLDEVVAAALLGQVPTTIARLPPAPRPRLVRPTPARRACHLKTVGHYFSDPFRDHPEEQYQQ